jgi:hypothetical protein
MSICYFYDVTVYRLDEKTYYSKRAIFIDEALFPKHSSDSDALRKRDNDNPRENMGFRDHLGRIYGGCWRFNETIGFIRLHFLGSQIRGDYFSVVRKRIVRTRTKTFEYRTWKLAPEIDLPAHGSNEDIFRTVLEYLSDCRNELPRRYIDAGLLEFIGPYIDWKRLLAATRHRRPAPVPSSPPI